MNTPVPTPAAAPVPADSQGSLLAHTHTQHALAAPHAGVPAPRSPAPAEESPQLKVQALDLVKRFAGAGGQPITALDRVSLTVPAGQLTALVGPDGAGKTTLLRMMAGLLVPDDGRLQVLGLDVVHHPQAVQDQISYMPQRFGLYEDLSVQENLGLYADLHQVPTAVRRERCQRLLAMTDMDRFVNRPAGKLSGGMKQKLGLACTLVRSPALLLLDEPSVGVDPLSRRDFWRIILQLVQAEALSVVISTAYLDEATRCDQVFVMSQGQVLARGTPEALRQQAEGLCYRAQPASGMPARMLQARLLDAHEQIVDAVPRGGDVCFVRQPDTPDSALPALLGEAQATPRPADLEDAFMMLLRQQAARQTDPHTATAAPTAPPPKPLPDGARPSMKPAMQQPDHDQESAERPNPTTRPASSVRSAEPVIIVRDLLRRFGDFIAVASTSFEVGRGEIFGLLGPNGAGKSTTFRMLCGLLPATSGFLQVAGYNLRTARAQARARIGYVAQKFSLYGNLSVRDNLNFFGGAYGLHGRALQQRIDEMLHTHALNADAISGLLPAGYKQRLAMAVGLLHQPDILFLDEPTSGIDPLARRAFWHTITTLAASGVTIIITTHFMEEAEYCDRIAIQDAGRMLALGTPAQVRAQAGGNGSADMNAAFIVIVEQARRRTSGSLPRDTSGPDTADSASGRPATEADPR